MASQVSELKYYTKLYWKNLARPKYIRLEDNLPILMNFKNIS